MWNWLMAVLLVAFVAGPAGALERFDIITTEQLREMLQARDRGEMDFTLVNTLDEIIFEAMAIPGSLSVPWCRVEETAVRLGEDRDKLIVTY